MTTPPLAPHAAPPTPPLPTDPGRLHRAARGMEALFARQLLAHLAERLPGTGGGPGSAIYASMLQDAIAEAASQRGALGIAPMLVRQLAPTTPSHAHRVDQG